MCVETYNGCPGCGATHDDITWETSETYTHSWSIDEDGDADDCFESEGQGDTHNERYYCQNCGDHFASLEEREPEDCDCEECEPEHEPDDIVVLMRRGQHIFTEPDLIKSKALRTIAERRSVKAVRCTYRTACEATAELEGFDGRTYVGVRIDPVHDHPSDLPTIREE